MAIRGGRARTPAAARLALAHEGGRLAALLWTVERIDTMGAYGAALATRERVAEAEQEELRRKVRNEMRLVSTRIDMLKEDI